MSKSLGNLENTRLFTPQKEKLKDDYYLIETDSGPSNKEKLNYFTA